MGTSFRTTVGRLHPGTPVMAAALTAALAAALLAGCGSSASTAPTTSPSPAAHATTPSVPSSSASNGAGLAPPTVPATGAYLGAWLHPGAPGQGSSFAMEQATLPSVVAATGRPLGLLHVYAPWARPAPVASLRAVAAAGSTPILDWGCGPDVAQLASGTDDGVISTYASDLRAYGAPVLLRWCWEMNLVGLHPQVGGPSGFTGAWVHIRSLFRRAGATNVAFVWCPALSGVDPQPYFPGAGEVDWIAVDGYDRDGTQTFASLFTPFYRAWVGQGKPMMVGETGAAGSAQAPFIDSIATGAPTLPAVKAVAYFDAPGPLSTWQFTSAGLQAFARLASQPYFQPRGVNI
jgi:hypothetical protein